jgi:hypothetical protein
MEHEDEDEFAAGAASPKPTTVEVARKRVENIDKIPKRVTRK